MCVLLILLSGGYGPSKWVIREFRMVAREGKDDK